MVRTTPKISVVIPAFNVAPFIEDQVEALLANNLTVDEIVIADNGSTDSTHQITEHLMHKHGVVRYLDASQRKGANFARNLGIEFATHDLILLCDADDVVASNWAEKLVAELESNDLVGSGYQHYVMNEVTGAYEVESTVLEQPTVFGVEPYSLSCSMGMKKSVFNAISGFDESYKGGHEEVDFCLRVSSAGFTQGWIPEPLILYRQRPSRKGLAKQSRNYGRTWVQLAQNFSPIYDHHVPSLKLMIRKVAPQIPNIFMKKKMGWEELRGFYWNLGRLEGVFKYRVLKRTPQRNLHSPSSRFHQEAVGSQPLFCNDCSILLHIDR